MRDNFCKRVEDITCNKVQVLIISALPFFAPCYLGPVHLHQKYEIRVGNQRFLIKVSLLESVTNF